MFNVLIIGGSGCVYFSVSAAAEPSEPAGALQRPAGHPSSSAEPSQPPTPHPPSVQPQLSGGDLL